MHNINSRIELATMRLAAECGLNMPRLECQRLLDRDIYLIQRFGRHINTEGTLRLPFASGLTMLGAHESEVSRFAYADLAAAIRRYGTGVREADKGLFATCFRLAVPENRQIEA